MLMSSTAMEIPHFTQLSLLIPLMMMMTMMMMMMLVILMMMTIMMMMMMMMMMMITLMNVTGFSHLTDTLEVLLDGGANHNFVNSDGKTATDMVVTDEARGILSERKTLELKSIAAKAVKKLGLPYLGLVPKTLEKFISMH